MTILSKLIGAVCFLTFGALLAAVLHNKHKQWRIQRRIKKYYWHHTTECGQSE